MKRLRRVFLLGLAAESAASAWAWSRLPARVPMHWDLRGDVDRWGPRFQLLLLGPAILLILWAVAESMRYIDPKIAAPAEQDESPQEREGTLRTVLGIVGLLLVLLHALVLGQALGLLREPQRAHGLLLSGFQVLLGNFVGRLRPTWFVGIRTPWTLSSDDVWRRTHRLAARWMVPSGLLSLVLTFALPAAAVVGATAGLLVVSLLVPAALSFVFWRRTV